MPDQINELAILVSAILAVAIGTIWYSPLLFGAFRNKPQEINSVVEDEPSNRAVIQNTAVNVFVQILFFIVIGYFISLSFEFEIPLRKIGVLLALLIGAQTLVVTVRERQSLRHFLIYFGYSTLVVFGGLGVISYWPW